jgi:hypothetical protein
MYLSLLPEIPFALSELLCFKDLAHLVGTCKGVSQELELANQYLASYHFGGVEPFYGQPFKAGLFQQLKGVLQPQCLLHAECGCPSNNNNTKPSSLTVPMSAVFETSGTFFIEFWTCVADAANCCPSIGIIDAEKAPLEDDKWAQDMSRPDDPFGTLGLACNPFSGKVHVSSNTSFTKKLEDDLYQSCEGAQPRSFYTTLDWESYEALARGPDRVSIWSAVLISGGKLEFYRRKGPRGLERSGTICECLPSKVLCCAFLNEFVGEAVIFVGKVHLHLPDACTCTQSSDGVELSAWTPWPHP